MQELPKLNLGAGHDQGNGYISLDIAGRPEVLADGCALPFVDGSFGEVKAHHVLEHIERRALVRLMNECHRVLAEGGQLDIEVPLFPSEDSMNDPTHVSWFGPKTFDYFTEKAPHRDLYGILPWRYLRKERLGYNSILGVTLQKCVS